LKAAAEGKRLVYVERPGRKTIPYDWPNGTARVKRMAQPPRRSQASAKCPYPNPDPTTNSEEDSDNDSGYSQWFTDWGESGYESSSSEKSDPVVNDALTAGSEDLGIPREALEETAEESRRLSWDLHPVPGSGGRTWFRVSNDDPETHAQFGDQVPPGADARDQVPPGADAQEDSRTQVTQKELFVVKERTPVLAHESRGEERQAESDEENSQEEEDHDSSTDGEPEEGLPHAKQSTPKPESGVSGLPGCFVETP
jgi:hypothetical protein